MIFDSFYMKKAMNLAKKGQFTTNPNPNVGCIIVKNNKIIGKGWHKKTGGNHAEIVALKMAGNKAKGATMYVTLEPCSHFGKTPPCCQKIATSGLSKIVIGTKDPNPINFGKGIQYLSNKGITIKTNILTDKLKQINKGFFKRMTTGYPFIQLKLGSTLDGRIATNNGCSKWITSFQSRNDVQYFRAKSSAILSSSNTILADNPHLNVRHTNINMHEDIKKIFVQPIRIIIDSQHKIKKFHKCLNIPGKVLLVRIQKDNICWPNNVQQLVVNSCNNKIDLLDLFLKLGNKQINNVWIESGPTLAGILIQKKMLDEIIIYIAPKILGHHSKPLFIINKIFQSVLDSINLSFKDIRQIGPDIRIILTPIY